METNAPYPHLCLASVGQAYIVATEGFLISKRAARVQRATQIKEHILGDQQYWVSEENVARWDFQDTQHPKQASYFFLHIFFLLLFLYSFFSSSSTSFSSFFTSLTKYTRNHNFSIITNIKGSKSSCICNTHRCCFT